MFGLFCCTEGIPKLCEYPPVLNVPVLKAANEAKV